MLRKLNTDNLKEIHSKLKLIDKEKLDKLKSEADHARKKYEPLLAEYTDLGKKAAEARKRKDRKSAVMFDLKRNRIKASANAARQEIKVKRDALTAAKKLASAKVKAVKEALVPVQALKKQITAENKKISDYNKNRIASDKRYKSAVKLGDAIMAAAELRQIVGYLGSVQSSQKSIYEWESGIRKTIQAAESKLPR
ncbi:hypothetical protein [Paenibacillus sp. DMB20]|uniref:hypothetical protein n=1 Tax=Paenibacillus sp. DMB20 TaxID=1642570 RepID=UPI000627C5BC|nr:hypothetical protein [Paenibacillus sp. DMB20]KKO52493.1 hypothetical protein XI25_20230 [Paenibacillus sp. DMB20]